MSSDERDIGSVVRQLRLRAGMSRTQLGVASGVSASHLTRIGNGERFPSAKVLQKIASHLHVDECELLVLAGYVSAEQCGMFGNPDGAKLDPYVAILLSQEPVEVQRAVLGIFSMVKYIAEGIAYEKRW